LDTVRHLWVCAYRMHLRQPGGLGYRLQSYPEREPCEL
jgi:hypothetical protein